MQGRELDTGFPPLFFTLIPQLREIMGYDEMELDKLGDRRTAAFFIISDTDTTYNFIVALAFSQMFNLLCERADNVHGDRLPHHVRVLWDEAANTGQVPNLEKLVAVIRSREVSLTLFYQQLYGFFHFCYRHFEGSGDCAGRWPRRVGRCQSAGGLRLGQPRFQCSCTVKKKATENKR